jgi:hypothetical protein
MIPEKPPGLGGFITAALTGIAQNGSLTKNCVNTASIYTAVMQNFPG